MAEETSGPALGTCQFICEEFVEVEELGTGIVLPDGTYTTDAETTPLGFTYFSFGFPWELQTTSYWMGMMVAWGRFLAPAVSGAVSYLRFPPGVEVGLAYLRVRSRGGLEWEVIPVDNSLNHMGNPATVDGGDIEPKSLFLCGEDFFTGVIFRSPSGASEPAVYEVCIPQDPDGCLAR